MGCGSSNQVSVEGTPISSKSESPLVEANIIGHHDHDKVNRSSSSDSNSNSNGEGVGVGVGHSAKLKSLSASVQQDSLRVSKSVKSISGVTIEHAGGGGDEGSSHSHPTHNTEAASSDGGSVGAPSDSADRNGPNKTVNVKCSDSGRMGGNAGSIIMIEETKKTNAKREKLKTQVCIFEQKQTK